VYSEGDRGERAGLTPSRSLKLCPASARRDAEFIITPAIPLVAVKPTLLASPAMRPNHQTITPHQLSIIRDPLEPHSEPRFHPSPNLSTSQTLPSEDPTKRHHTVKPKRLTDQSDPTPFILLRPRQSSDDLPCSFGMIVMMMTSSKEPV
jgi:hypothetical protein